MAEETKAPSAGSSHGDSRPERSGPPRGPRPGGGPGGPREGAAASFSGEKVCKFCRRKIEAVNYKDVRSAGAVRGGKRQDHAATPDRRVHAASAAFVAGHQAGAEYRTAAVRWTRAVKKKLLAPSF